MSNPFFSSKSLLSKVGLENNDTQLPQNDEKDDSVHSEDAGFLLVSTLNNIPDANKVRDDEFIDKSSKAEREADTLENKELMLGTPIETHDNANDNSDDSDNEIVMKVTDTPSFNHNSKTLKLMSLLNPSKLLKLHDLLLSSFYDEHKYELLTRTKLTMRVITWNLSQFKPPYLKELAGENSREWAAFFYAEDAPNNNFDISDSSRGLADIYSINFQETISLKSFSKSDDAINQWVKFLLTVLNALSPEKYSCVSKKGLLGLTTIILAKAYLAVDEVTGGKGQIHDIKEDTIGLGYLRWANKGCISVKFIIGGIPCGIGMFDNISEKLKEESIYELSDLDDTAAKLPGLEVQVLNVHLVHGEDDTQVKQRWEAWEKIQKNIGLNDRSVQLAYDPQDSSLKSRMRKRLESKLRSKSKSADISELQEDDFKDIDCANDSVRFCNLPLQFTSTEKAKFENHINDVDLYRFSYVTEATKAVVVCGDANYRLSLPQDTSTREHIYDAVKNAAWDDLLKHDQFLGQMKERKVMLGLTEAPVKFAPTFKIMTESYGKWIAPKTAISRYRKPVPGTENLDQSISHPYYVPRYDTKRLPAYTDRILYSEKDYFKMIPNTYHSVPLRGSDHLPVTASYNLEAPLVNYKKLHNLKNYFVSCWNDIINKLRFMSFEESVYLERSFVTKFPNNTEDSSILKETIDFNCGHLNLNSVAGETIRIVINMKNLTDEDYRLFFKEYTKRGWFETKIEIDCKELGDTSAENTSVSSCRVKANGKAQIILSFTLSSIETLDRTFVAEIPEYETCPEYRKHVALSVKVFDIFHSKFEELSDIQFENILNCLRFIYDSSEKGLLERIKQIETPNDLNATEWNLVREITLYQFNPTKYIDLNKASSNNALQSNYGTIIVLSVIYGWMKSQSSAFTINSKRGKIFFSEVLKLIKFLHLDATQGYDLFGWIFLDEHELDEYLERDFDVKLQL
ncbi:hypothetical protein CANINC_001064 [Pichia inconspicua]|uniref:Inositol polyphosphate-related phosphatase domain-containing protein n=1 Tax=Pichia inconspicua TaxID=52247 RepID=A0A4T0X5U4_9ASCO|nr:hypothetical protein CANINC_001064 [[Candida] inconspicua]